MAGGGVGPAWTAADLIGRVSLTPLLYCHWRPFARIITGDEYVESRCRTGRGRKRSSRSGAPSPASSATTVIDLSSISRSHLETEPYRWAAVSGLFAAADAAALAATFPTDHFKRVADHAGEKKHEYQVRSLIRMSEQSISGEKQLSSAWQALARDFLSPAYRNAMSRLIGIDLSAATLK